MDLAALVSGGKDSLYALYKLHQEGHLIKYLLLVIPERTDSYMFHHPNANFVSLQAEAMGIPLKTVRTKGEKEKELEDLKSLVASAAGEVEGIVTGALASQYQRTRIDAICEDLGLESLAPLWGMDPEEYWGTLLADDFKVMITAVAAGGIDESWLGRVVDREALEELKTLAQKHRFHLAFEGGEAETFVLDMPLFKAPIRVEKAETTWDGVRGTYGFVDVSLP